LQKAYTFLNYRQGDFSVSERAADKIVSLPMFPQLSKEQQARVAEEILDFTSTTSRKQSEIEIEGVSINLG
jgi:dTDP-4-amino-4,6-dideoxygalactose transaminase